VLEPEDISAVLEASESMPRASIAAQLAGANAGPSSPPMAKARHPALEPAAPIDRDRPRAETLPVRKVALDPPKPEKVAAEDDFEGGQSTDVENQLQGDATRIEANPMESATAMAAMRRPATSGEMAPVRAPTGAEGKKHPTPPPRKVLTPPGLRAGGAPLDPLPGEREALLAASTPPPTVVPPVPTPQPLPAPPKFVEAPTMMAPDARLAPAAGGGRFADAPTVHHGATPPGTPRFNDAPTVHAVGTPSQMSAAPATGQTQMLEPADLVEVGTDPVMPQAAAQHQAWLQQPPQQAISMPPPDAAFPNQPYYQQVAGGGDSAKIPPWALGIIFFIVLALATGITVAVARALH
jgi:hypothetical protein